MSTSHTAASRTKRFFNGLLCFCSLWTGLLVAYFCYSARANYSDLSISIHGFDKPLMNSSFLEFAGTWVVAIIMLGLVLLVGFKRFYLKTFKQMVVTNAVSALFFMGIAVALLLSVYRY